MDRSNMKSTTWYHGGDFKNGVRTGVYIYLTDDPVFALNFAKKDGNPDARVYRLGFEFAALVIDHPNGIAGKVIRQTDVQERGGVNRVFEDVTGQL